ncbi:MAG: hypothetical protein R2860_09055 [Desulfobacterales bacterium]
MKDIFKDVMGIDGVHGLMVLSDDGSVMISKFSSDFKEEEETLSGINWEPFVT